MRDVTEFWIIGLHDATQWALVIGREDKSMSMHGAYASRMELMNSLCNGINLDTQNFALVLDAGDVEHFKREAVKL